MGSTDFHWLRVAAAQAAVVPWRRHRAAFGTAWGCDSIGDPGFKRFWAPRERPLLQLQGWQGEPAHWQQHGQTCFLRDWGSGESWEPLEALQCRSGSCLCGRGTAQFPFPASAGSHLVCISRGVIPSVCTSLIFCQDLLKRAMVFPAGPCWV